MIHIRIESFQPNQRDVTIDTVMPARGVARYQTSEGCNGKIELEIIVDREEDLIGRSKEILDKLAELDFCNVERPWAG